MRYPKRVVPAGGKESALRVISQRTQARTPGWYVVTYDGHETRVWPYGRIYLLCLLCVSSRLRRDTVGSSWLRVRAFSPSQ